MLGYQLVYKLDYVAINGPIDDGTANLAKILVPCIVGPLLIALIVYVIVKIKRRRD